MKCWSILATLVMVSSANADLRPLFESLREVESGGNPNLVGDGGRSIGPYQIQWAYWKDAGVSGSYRQVRDPRYAERVMLAYWKRYCPDALARRDYQTLARVHNGGLAGHRKTATLGYWRKVANELAERKSTAVTDSRTVRQRR